MRHIISVMLENESGALSRVAGMFSARGFNIESLTVAPTNDETLSRLTVVSVGDDNIIEQIVKQLNKIIDVVEVTDLTSFEHIERELMLIKLNVSKANLTHIMKQIETFSGKIVDASDDTYTVELAGQSKNLDAFMEKIDQSLIIEISRTGVTGVIKGNK
ncbi:MAG TPA: acetolactate synthase small subunit [Candidatus Thioglobus sp.]|nr:acetolactate synthase small subunit [Candidatus Thioglobus sp.]HIL42681.1 acetolactate synthase small subunit [Gammaproteobacteria bacterium]